MADPICAKCRKPILVGEDWVTIQDTSYHMGCWDRKQRRR